MLRSRSLHLLPRALALAACLAAAGCGHDRSRDPERGVWRSVGYGYVLDDTGAAPVLYETAGTSWCVRSPEAYGPRGPVRSQLLDGGRRRRAWFGIDVAPITFERLAALPDACRGGGASPADDPVLTLAVLCRTFQEQYAFFPERDPEFPAQCAAAQGALAAEPTPAKLGELVTGLLSSLDDGHVQLYLSPTDVRGFEAPSRIQRQLQAEFEAQTAYDDLGAYVQAQAERFEAIREGYAAGGLQSAAGGALRWGRLGEQAGYVVLDATELADEPATEQGQVEPIAAAFDQALAELGALPTLVLDLRRNGGGYDAVALALAGRLTAAAYPAFGVSAWDGAAFTAPSTVQVTPRGGGYAGRVVVLTSEVTASAAEVLVLALQARGGTTVVGEATHGAFSDQLLRTLPNGWVVSLSNERYQTLDGRCDEVAGIAPDLDVPFFAQEDREAGRDAALDAALGLP
jgi:hypothetical protein